MSRIESYSTVLATLSSSVAQVSLTLLPQPSTIETSLFARLFGSAPPIRLGSDGDDAEDDINSTNLDDDDGDGFDFLRLMAPRSKVFSDVLEQHQRDAAQQRNDIVKKWITQFS